MGKETTSGKIQSIERMVHIMNQFTLQQTELRFTELVELTGLNKSTAFNIISTMETLGILEQDQRTKVYRLGIRLIKMGEVAKKSLKIIDVARPFMKELRDETDETVQLAKLERNQTVYLEKVESNQPIKTHSHLGEPLAAHATGLGKVLLAYKPLSYIENYFSDKLEKFTVNTISNRSTLLLELTEIKRRGYAMDQEEYIEGLDCYAAPIFDIYGNAVYAISVSIPCYRLSAERQDGIIQAVIEKAHLISLELGS